MKHTNEYKQRAYEFCTTCANIDEATNDQLIAAKEWADELKFYADMCDDYTVTRAEKAAINATMRNVYEAMRQRNI